MAGLANVDPQTACGAACGALGTGAALAGDLALRLLGVDLTVVVAAAAGAGAARCYAEPVGFARALLLSTVWTVLGCVGAPVAQALVPWALALMPGSPAFALPPKALAGLAAVIASSPLWWPKVWPLVKDRWPFASAAKKGGGQ